MFSDWDIRLAKWIDAIRNKPFQWGPHDCITFANNAAIQMRGYGFADEFLDGYSTQRGAMIKYQRFLRKSNYADLIDGLDDRLSRLNTNYAPRGSISAQLSKNENNVLPLCFGISIGKHIAFVGDNGLVLEYPSENMLYWSLSDG
jgi:hypothetical protein